MSPHRESTSPGLSFVSPIDQTYHFTNSQTDLDYVLESHEPLVSASYSIDGSPALLLIPSSPTRWISPAGEHPSLEIDGDNSGSGNGVDLGIALAGRGFQVHDNLIELNQYDGILFINSDSSIIETNEIIGNKRDGIQLAATAGTVIRDNEVSFNGYVYERFGINLKSGSAGNTVYHNSLITNGRWGLGGAGG